VQKVVDTPDTVHERWRVEFARLHAAIAAIGRSGADGQEGMQVAWGLVDGFLMYWDAVRLLPPVGDH